jgi:hypothetical protein
MRDVTFLILAEAERRVLIATLPRRRPLIADAAKEPVTVIA